MFVLSIPCTCGGGGPALRRHARLDGVDRRMPLPAVLRLVDSSHEEGAIVDLVSIIIFISFPFYLYMDYDSGVVNLF